MSQQEFSRLEVLLRVQSGRLRIADACELIGLRRCQVFRLLRRCRFDALRSRERSCPVFRHDHPHPQIGVGQN
jgi:hypothetical protein